MQIGCAVEGTPLNIDDVVAGGDRKSGIGVEHRIQESDGVVVGSCEQDRGIHGVQVSEVNDVVSLQSIDEEHLRDIDVASDDGVVAVTGSDVQCVQMLSIGQRDNIIATARTELRRQPWLEVNCFFAVISFSIALGTSYWLQRYG